MYKDILLKEYKHRCIVGLRLIIIVHALIITLAPIDYFILKELPLYIHISAYVFATCIYIIVAYEDYLKMIAISKNKYRAITVACIKTSRIWGRYKSGYEGYYSFKYELCKARLTRKHFKAIKEGDRVLLVTFGSNNNILILRDDLHPLP